MVGNPPWVAPGLQLLYRADGAGRAGIRFLVSREGNEVAITRGPATSAPSFDRRSGWVFFAARENGSWDLYRVRLSGEERAPLVATPGVNERWPAPSPDGRFLVYTSDASGRDQIYRCDLDGGNPTPVTQGPEPHSQAAVDSSGTRLLALEGEDQGARLVSIDVATGAVTALEGAAAFPPAGEPALGKDGAIAYTCRGPQGLDICRLSPGESARRITEDPAEDREAAWSPDGSLIAFSSNRADGNFELYAVRADGSKVRRLTKEPGSDGEPFWVP